MSIFAGPVRGGNRGGRELFKWEDVKTDKQRENYLGASLYAPIGRWQKGKDLQWYSKERDGKDGKGKKASHDEQLKKEMDEIRKLEQDAIAEALGLGKAERIATKLTKDELREALKKEEDDFAPKEERVLGVGFKGLASASKKPTGGVFTEFEGADDVKSSKKRSKSDESSKSKKSKRQ